MKLAETKKAEINYSEKITVEMTLSELVMIMTAIGNSNSNNLATILESRNEHLALASRIKNDGGACHTLYQDLVKLDGILNGGKQL